MPDPITPTLPDPQASVDAALGSLGTSTPTSPTTPSAPVVEPPKPEVLPVQPTTPTPVMNAPMGDETPLAFAAPTLNAMPTTPSPTPEPTPTPAPAMPAATVSPVMSEVPKLEPMPNVGSSYLPPVPPAPITTPTAETKPKKKSKILLVVLGIFALLGGLGVAGYYSYMNLTGVVPLVAPVDVAGPEECAAKQCEGGHALVWRNGQCVWAARLCDAGNGGGGGSTQGPLKSNGPNQECYYDNNNNGSMDSADTGYGFYCGGAIDKCVSNGDLNAAGGGCNAYGESIGIPTVYGANYSKPDANGNCAIKKCNCGTTPVCFDKTGYCDQKDVVATGGIVGTNYNTVGLCAVAGSYSGSGTDATFTANDPSLTTTGYSCTDAGCTTTDPTCTTVRYTCSGTVGGNSCTNQSSAYIANSEKKGITGFANKCGTVEQLDVMCGGVYKTSRTKINPPCDTTPSDNPATHKACNTTTKVCETVTGAGADTCTTDANCVTAAPVLACTGLTQTPATTPAIGDKVTFTCAGTITPTGAAALSYKFRYSLDGGADQLLANKTPTTAELTINACGTYSVQCKVCATIAGVLKCDPTWTGAIQ